MPEITPPQTIGPFFHGSLIDEPRSALPTADGEPIRIRGRVLDGDGLPVDDAMLEIWQADAHGRYHHPVDAGFPEDEAFTGFGRSATDAEGVFCFDTIRPGAVPWPGSGRQSPHLNVHVFARGLLDRLATRIYFGDDEAVAGDPILQRLPEHRRATLLARREEDADGVEYRFDVVLQGENETVFFDA